MCKDLNALNVIFFYGADTNKNAKTMTNINIKKWAYQTFKHSSVLAY